MLLAGSAAVHQHHLLCALRIQLASSSSVLASPGDRGPGTCWDCDDTEEKERTCIISNDPAAAKSAAFLQTSAASASIKSIGDSLTSVCQPAGTTQPVEDPVVNEPKFCHQRV
jgi:hypothetical protein